jgi:hypothetical protein
VAKAIRYSEDKPLTEQVAAAIGAMTVQWGHLEDGAGVLIAVLLGINHFDFRAVTSNMIGRSKFEALMAVADLKLPPSKARAIKQIAEKALSLSAERNRIVHGCWFATKNPNVAERYNYHAKGKLSSKHEEVSAARMMGFEREIAKLVRRCNRALSRFGFFKKSSA